MAAKIGILGESTSTAGGSVTLYTVPSSKAARIKLQYFVEGGGSVQHFSFEIGSPGSERHINIAENVVSVDWCSGAAWDNGNNNILLASFGHLVLGTGYDLTGAPADDTGYAMLPWPPSDNWYFLSTGDTVVVTTNGTQSDAIFQVVGIEDDA